MKQGMDTRKGKKRFFASHAKSSAALVSLCIHAVLIVIALSFVAVSVIQKDDQKFEAKPVSRPKMKLRKLQVPVNIKKKAVQKPKLRKRIVVQPKINQNVPDIKMPEITGVKGGLGSGAAGGIGGSGGIGFSMPEINIFGVKGKGEKIFIILDASAFMMVDEIGGIPAYTIIKSELVRILEGLNPTVLFNIAIYGGGDRMLFPKLVPATQTNVAKVHDWLKPLNAVSKGMGDKDYGPRTAAPGAVAVPGPFKAEPLVGRLHDWGAPTMAAMRQQADVVFVLTCRWGHQAYVKKGKKAWSESQMDRYRQKVAEAKALHKKENDKRRAAGQPPRVVAHGDRGLVRTYLPGTPLPPMPEWGWYTPKEIVQAFATVRSESTQGIAPLKSGLSKKKKENFTINVIQFLKADGTGKDQRFGKLASITRGEYRTIDGLEAIRSYVGNE